MNWDAVSAIAELLGSAAVVITLIFVIVQLKQNSSAVKNATTQAGSDTYTEIMTSLVSDPDLFDIYFRGIRSTEELSKSEYARFEIIILNMLRMADMQFRQHQNGGGDEEHWDSIRRSLVGLLQMPGAYASWQRQKGVFTASFVKEVDGWGVTPNK